MKNLSYLRFHGFYNYFFTLIISKVECDLKESYRIIGIKRLFTLTKFDSLLQYNNHYNNWPFFV
jgi:hypothetical protein